jgi:hypothetical protein
MFRMEIEKARAIQKLLLKYIDIAIVERPPGSAVGAAHRRRRAVCCTQRRRAVIWRGARRRSAGRLV